MASFTVITNYQTTLAQGMTASQLTCVLSSVTLQGHAITNSDYGSYLYITINPGAANMEVVRATSNSGTTFTIDLRGLAWYGASDTELSAYKFTHNAGEIVVISNVKNVYEQLVDKLSDETVGGIKTFTSLPVIPILPLNPTDAASKDYVDDIASTAGGITAFSVTKNGSDPTLTINVGSGEWMFNDTPTLFAGASGTAVSAASTNYVELSPGNAVSVNTTGFTSGYLPMGIVVADGTTITSVTDRRAWLTNASQQQPITATFTYGGTITAGDPVYLDSADGKVKKALATGASTSDSFIGIALDSGVNNDTGKRVQTGGTITSLSGMTAGFQYISDTGTLSTTPGTYRRLVGFAGTATKMVLMPGILATAITGANSDTSTAVFNEAMTFFANTSITGAQATTLSAGVTSNADSLHTHDLSNQITQQLLLRNVVEVQPGGVFNYTDAITAGGVEPYALFSILYTAGGAGDDALTYLQLGSEAGLSTTEKIDWDSNLYMGANIESDVATDQDLVWGFWGATLSAVPANATSTVRHVAFLIEDGTIYASVADGTTQTRSAIAGTVTSLNTYEIVYTAATSAVFKINGTTLATLTTNLPASNGSEPFHMLGVTAIGAAAKGFIIYNNFVLKSSIA